MQTQTQQFDEGRNPVRFDQECSLPVSPAQATLEEQTLRSDAPGARAAAAAVPAPETRIPPLNRVIGRLCYAGLPHEFPLQAEPETGRRRYQPGEVCSDEQADRLNKRFSFWWLGTLAASFSTLTVPLALPLMKGLAQGQIWEPLAFAGTLGAIVAGALPATFLTWNALPGHSLHGYLEARRRFWSAGAADRARGKLDQHQSELAQALAAYQRAQHTEALDLDSVSHAVRQASRLVRFIDQRSDELASPGLDSDAIPRERLAEIRRSSARVEQELSFFAVRALNDTARLAGQPADPRHNR